MKLTMQGSSESPSFAILTRSLCVLQSPHPENIKMTEYYDKRLRNFRESTPRKRKVYKRPRSVTRGRTSKGRPVWVAQ